MVLDKLTENEEFLKSSVWKLYLKVKRISELVCSDKLSECQVQELEKEIALYVDIRIALKNISKPCEDNEAVVIRDNFLMNQQLGELETNIIWSELKPKHIFLLSYGRIIRRIGSLADTRTLRPESKNGDLKRYQKSSIINQNILQRYFLQGHVLVLSFNI